MFGKSGAFLPNIGKMVFGRGWLPWAGNHARFTMQDAQWAKVRDFRKILSVSLSAGNFDS
ncbi:MAG: hypothetical protein IJS32_02350 [Kiritimatiellae bacterium]|nr:hypothetical protein [Kiritimatiellia bacterium]